jgi:hypothetical protein
MAAERTSSDSKSDPIGTTPQKQHLRQRNSKRGRNVGYALFQTTCAFGE